MSAKRIFGLIALVAGIGTGTIIIKKSVVPVIEVAPVARGTAVLTATGNVTVTPSLDSRVSSPAQGILKTFKHKEGSPVKKGDIIAEIDQGQWPFRLEELRLELNRITQRIESKSPTEIDLEKLRTAYETNKKSGNVPAEIIESNRRDIEKYEMAVRLEKSDLQYTRSKLNNQIDEIQQEINRRTIRAGYDGVIMVPSALEGDLVMHNQGLCNITSRQKAVKVEINQDDLPAAKNSRKVLVRFFTEGDKVYEGKIAEVIPFGDQKTQRFTVFVNLPSMPDHILSAQTGEATFIADEHPNALLIPRKALIGSECFVVEGDTVKKRKLRIGYTTLNDAEVLDGLKEGELVVTKDADLRRDGEKVKIAESPKK